MPSPGSLARDSPSRLSGVAPILTHGNPDPPCARSATPEQEARTCARSTTPRTLAIIAIPTAGIRHVDSDADRTRRRVARCMGHVVERCICHGPLVTSGWCDHSLRRDQLEFHGDGYNRYDAGRMGDLTHGCVRRGWLRATRWFDDSALRRNCLDRRGRPRMTRSRPPVELIRDRSNVRGRESTKSQTIGSFL